jgi:ABC-type antimicrobial peptide transport system permease subunit
MRCSAGRTTLKLREGDVTAEVAGLIPDAWVLRGPAPAPEVFAPFDRLPSARFQLVITTSDDRRVSERDVMAAVRTLDAGVPLIRFGTLRELTSWSTVVPRFQTMVFGLISVIALVLAATGCFAVLSQMVGRRTRELGIRMALGARAASIMRLVLGRVGVLTALGVLAGSAAALAATRLLESELYGVTPSDATTYVTAAAVLAATVLLAAARPLWRALRIDPMRSLRDTR